jgi:arylsulfatase
MVDEQAFPWHLQGLTLNRPAQTELASSSILFNRHMTNSLMCSPARACIQTGLYSLQNGIQANVGMRLSDGSIQGSLNPAIPTLGSLLGASGYTTAYRGKWNLSTDTSSLTSYGYSDWEGVPSLPPSQRLLQSTGAEDGTYADPVIAQSACQWLQNRDPGQGPWFLIVSFINPHDITFPNFVNPGFKGRIRPGVTLPVNWNTDMSTRPAIQRVSQRLARPPVLAGFALKDYVAGDPSDWLYYISAYTWLLEQVDVQIGLVLDAVRATDPDLSNTVIIFTSDHGDQGGAQGLPWKGPWIYKESINVPLMICYPGSQGQEINVLSQHIDLLPTICGFAGVPVPPGLPGMDLMKVVAASPVPANRNFFFEMDFAMSSSPMAAKIYGTIVDTPTGRFKYGSYCYASGKIETELYALQESPADEITNLAGTNPVLEAQLNALIQSWIAQTAPALS